MEGATRALRSGFPTAHEQPAQRRDEGCPDQEEGVGACLHLPCESCDAERDAGDREDHGEHEENDLVIVFFENLPSCDEESENRYTREAFA